MTRAAAKPDPIRALLAFALLVELVLAGVLLVKAWPHDEPVPPAPGEPALLLSQDGEPVAPDGLSGTITITLDDAPPGGADLVVRWSDDTETVLAQGATTASWNTATVTNGPYALVAVAGDSTLAESSVSVQNARADAATTVAVVGTTTVVAAGGSAVGSTLGSRAAIAAAQIGKESLIAVGEDHLALRTAHKQRRRLTSMAALGVTLLLVFLFFPFEGLERYLPSEYAAAIPVAGGVSMIFVAAALGSEFLLGVAGRAATKVRFLTSGAISLAASSIIFRTPFGYPGYVEEVDDEDADGTDDELPHVEGVRALAGLTFLLTLLVPFLWIGYRYSYAIVDQAMEIALVGLATSALPVRPLPGYDIWTWRRSVAVGYCAGAFVLYFGFMLAFLPTDLLPPLGAFGAVLYLGTLAWLRGRSAEPQPAWYVRSVGVAQEFGATFRGLTPRVVLDFTARVGHGAARATDAVVAGLVAATKAAVRPVTAVGARLQDRRFERLRREAEAQYERDLAAVMEQLQGLDDDDTFTIIDADGNAHSYRVGDLRDDAYRAALVRSLGRDPPAIVTVVDGESARTVYLHGAEPAAGPA